MTDHAGYDPYDALRGRRVPAWVRRSPRARQIVTQLRRRLPFALGPLLGVTPFAMAKTLGCWLTASARRGDEGSMRELLQVLGTVDGNLHDGAYGYEFDVQTRWAFYPAGSPNLIATFFVARGLGDAGVATGSSALLQEMVSSANFLSNHLVHAGEHPFFCYTPSSSRLVHNANLLGAALVASAGALSGDQQRIELALDCAEISILAQRPDGSWPYGEGESLSWSDNFHTAYNLDALLQLWLSSGNDAVRSSLELGVDAWNRCFFGPQGEPRYYPSHAYPYDIHSAATAVDVTARLATWGWATEDLAERVAAWTERSLIDPTSGLTYYQKHRLWTDKRHFTRWGDAHWALGRSSLQLMREGRTDPLEAAVAASSGVRSDAR